MSSGFTKKGISSLVKQVNKYKNSQEILDEIMERLCVIGVKAIKSAYSDGMTGESKDSVVWNHCDNKWVISAESEGLLYLEFGAGIKKNADGALSAREHLDVIDTGNTPIYDIGTYGLGQGSNEKWYAPPIHMYTKGTEARHGFADAITAIYANVDRVTKEVLAKHELQ